MSGRHPSAVECAGKVRWSKDGILQQRFEIIDYAEAANPLRYEWRDVPTEEATSPPSVGR